MYKFRCIDDGYCTLEQADLIQQYVEKKIGKLYQIDEIIGKSVLTINDDEDEEDPKERKSMIISDDDDENSHSSPNGNQNSLITQAAKRTLSNDDNNVALSPSLTTNNRFSPSPPVPSPSKGVLSPGEITKGMSPSSLSEGSPILD